MAKRHRNCIPIRGICECRRDLIEFDLQTATITKAYPELELKPTLSDVKPPETALIREIERELEEKRFKAAVKEAVAEALAENK